jgi:mono/diheme cytochrome c family protein
MRAPILLGSILCALALGCEDLVPEITWERMIDQPRGKAYRSSAYFADGKLMQAPPEGAIPITRALGSSPQLAGTDAAGTYINAIPVPVDRALLVRGQNRFETFCATCHAVDGSGDSIVAEHMDLRKPPSLISDPVRGYEVGRVFQVITVGYGLMPSYSHELPVRDRWAVVGYLRALQRSQSSLLSQLPAAEQARAHQVLQ